MAEVPNPFEWNAEWDEKNKENFELVKKLDDNREDADARKVSNYTFLKETTSILKQKIIIIIIRLISVLLLICRDSSL